MYDLYIVRRTQIYIEEEQAERLARLAADADLTMSAVIRHAIDAHLDREGLEAARLLRFKAAVVDAAAVAPDLPSGEDYVEAIRPDYAARERSLRGKGD